MENLITIIFILLLFFWLIAYVKARINDYFTEKNERKEKIRHQIELDEKNKMDEKLEKNFQQQKEKFFQSEIYSDLKKTINNFSDSELYKIDPIYNPKYAPKIGRNDFGFSCNERDYFSLTEKQIKSAGFNFSKHRIYQIIHDIFKKKVYDNFKTAILFKDSMNINDYIYRFMEKYYHKIKFTTPSGKYEDGVYYDYYEERIRKYSPIYVEFLEKLLKEQGFKDITVGNIHEMLEGNDKTLDNMSGIEFENFLAKLFEKMGYDVSTTKNTGDQGADLIIIKDGLKTAVQAKRYNNKISNGAIQEVVAALKYYGVNNGMVITNSYFTQPAMKLAKINNIQLIDRDKLLEMRNTHIFPLFKD